MAETLPPSGHPASPAPVSPPGAPWIDLARARQTWRVEATFRRCLAEFRDREDDCIATLRDSPVDTWGKRVHRLKGSALVLAMPEVVAQAQALELALQQGASAEALGRGLDGLEAALRPTLGVIDDLLRQD